jgi:tyrosyl-tRNA synthetase
LKHQYSKVLTRSDLQGTLQRYHMENVLAILSQRGCIEATTDPELEAFLSESRRIYIGFDPTADSLHVGHLMGLAMARWFIQCGHTIVLLVGGATAMIGDPSGKSHERPLLTDEMVQAQSDSIGQLMGSLMGKKNVLLLNNADWFRKMGVLEFLRDVGRQFRVGTMLGKESVRARMESEEGISFTEFSYQMLQAYDFLYLYQHHGVTVQLGGSDQWGNITAGKELVRRVAGASVHGCTFPLLTRADGKKFGKTEEGAIWLSAKRLSPYQFYQQLVRLPDDDVLQLLRRLTQVPLEQIDALETNAVPNAAQARLAEELTRWIHGEEGLQAALKTTAELRPGGDAQLDRKGLGALAEQVPQVQLRREQVVGVKFVELLATSGLVPSRSQARQLVRNRGAYCNNERIEEEEALVAERHLIDGVLLLLSAGKKQRLLVHIQ